MGQPATTTGTATAAARPNPEISVVIPVHNEASQGARWLAQLRDELDAIGQQYEVLAVENGSTDPTLEMLEACAAGWPQLKVIALQQPCYGAAFLAGMRSARGDIVVSFDIDYWDVQLVRVARALCPLGFDIIVGSKNAALSHDARPRLRRLVSWGFRLLLQLLFRLPVSDTHGIKAWRQCRQLQEVLARVPPTHHVCDTEVVIRRVRAGARIVEIPVTVVECRRSRRPIVSRIPRALYELAGVRRRVRAA